jgi:superfamily II DNA or RNA helicase
MSFGAQTRQRECVYIDNFAWVPADKVNVRALRSSLAYGNMPSEAVLLGDHVRLPRHYMSLEKLESLGKVIREERSWPVSALKVRYPLRDYQVPAMKSMQLHRGGILNLGCGYGKTFMALSYIAQRGMKAAVVLGNTSLLEQWRQEAQSILEIDPKRIGLLQGNKCVWEDCDIVLISMSTLVNRARDGRLPENFCESFGVVFYDECHHLSAPMFSTTCSLFYGERHGLTATPRREDGLEQVFYNHLGGIHYTAVSQDLIPRCVFVKVDSDCTAQVERDSLSKKGEREILDAGGEINLRKLAAWLGRLDDRNRVIRGIASRELALGRKVLCLTHSVEHARTMHESWEGSGLASGEVPSDERTTIIRSHAITFATVDIAAEALDAPELSCMIVMTPFGARQQGNLLQQALGRIQRRSPGKEDAVFYYLYDHRIGICCGLTHQVRRKLQQWEYPTEVIHESTEPPPRSGGGLHSL